MAAAASRVKAGCGNRLIRLTFLPMSKADAERERRLAEALRQNLRRRKAQARAAGENKTPAALPDQDGADNPSQQPRPGNHTE